MSAYVEDMVNRGNLFQTLVSENVADKSHRDNPLYIFARDDITGGIQICQPVCHLWTIM